MHAEVRMSGRLMSAKEDGRMMNWLKMIVGPCLTVMLSTVDHDGGLASMIMEV